MNLFIEKFFPFFTSFLFTILTYFTLSNEQIRNITIIVLGKSFIVSGIFLGFLLTIITIIGSISTRKMQFVKQSGNYPRLLNYLTRAFYGNIGLLLVSFFVLTYQEMKISIIIPKSFTMLLLFLSLYVLLLSIRFSIVFIQLILDKN
jgi:hypothetical protein